MSTVPAIVVVAYNRPKALEGLLGGLLQADYSGHDVPLVISIDSGGDPAVVAMAETFNWPFGNKTIIKQATKLGLKQHILACGQFTKQYGSIILLEDDIEVAPGFYHFVIDALGLAQNENVVAGISLYSYTITECNYNDFVTYADGKDTYLMQFPSSWGQVWTAKHWDGFETWLKANPTPNQAVLPNYIQRWGTKSWKKLFTQYLIEQQKYFLYPKVSFSTNKGYAGTHFAKALGLFDVPLYQGVPIKLSPIEGLQRFDAYFEMEQSTLEKLSNTAFKSKTIVNIWSTKDLSKMDAEAQVITKKAENGIPVKQAVTNVLRALAQNNNSVFTLSKPTHIVTQPKRVTIEEAEYSRMVKQGLISPSALAKWAFIGTYRAANYLKAIKQLF